MVSPDGDAPQSPLMHILPTDLLSRVLSYVTDDVDVLSDLLLIVLPTTSNGMEAKGGDNDCEQDEREGVFRALCRLHWTSVRSHSSGFEGDDGGWRPKLGSWRTTYGVLQTWVPREGFYTVSEAGPWGMLVRLRFEDGRFVGDVLWPAVAEGEGGSGGGRIGALDAVAVRFDFVRALTVSFGEDGAATVSLCGVGDESRPSVILPVRPRELVKAVVVPQWPGDFSVRSDRALKLVLPTGPSSGLATGTGGSGAAIDRTGGEIARYLLWDPSFKAHPLTLFQSLWERRPASEGRTLTLDWVDGPSTDDAFEYLDGMPLIRPGLYSGVYVPDMYGKFKREVILVEYRKYDLGNCGQDEDEVWEIIRREVFSFPEQRDEHGFVDQVKTAARSSKCTSVAFVLGRKVTGDFHVPMQRITFGALVHPQLVVEDPPPRSVSDRGGGESSIEYRVINSWAGWGTLAYPGFQSPLWARGTLVQVEHPSGPLRRNSTAAVEHFGFMWEADDSEEDSHETSILTRMPEQDEFPWFS